MKIKKIARTAGTFLGGPALIGFIVSTIAFFIWEFTDLPKIPLSSINFLSDSLVSALALGSGVSTLTLVATPIIKQISTGEGRKQARNFFIILGATPFVLFGFAFTGDGFGGASLSGVILGMAGVIALGLLIGLVLGIVYCVVAKQESKQPEPVSSIVYGSLTALIGTPLLMGSLAWLATLVVYQLGPIDLPRIVSDVGGALFSPEVISAFIIMAIVVVATFALSFLILKTKNNTPSSSTQHSDTAQDTNYHANDASEINEATAAADPHPDTVTQHPTGATVNVIEQHSYGSFLTQTGSTVRDDVPTFYSSSAPLSFTNPNEFNAAPAAYGTNYAVTQ